MPTSAPSATIIAGRLIATPPNHRHRTPGSLIMLHPPGPRSTPAMGSLDPTARHSNAVLLAAFTITHKSLLSQRQAPQVRIREVPCESAGSGRVQHPLMWGLVTRSIRRVPVWATSAFSSFTLDRPDPLRPRPHIRPHRLVAGSGRLNPGRGGARGHRTTVISLDSALSLPLRVVLVDGRDEGKPGGLHDIRGRRPDRNPPARQLHLELDLSDRLAARAD